jgi:UTP:GlnB (protein PII) uridylyltransferase
LYALTTAFAVAGANVHAARIATEDDVAVDVFELTDTAGRKLGAGQEARIVEGLRAGTMASRRRRKILLRKTASSRHL